MSFSTPSMNPEVQTATQQYVTMPRMNSPFSHYNLQPTALGVQLSVAQQKGFPSAHMPSPWNTGHYMAVTPSTQKATGWGTSSLPPVDIEVISESPVVTKENTKIAWTSAEQLADALFPTEAENMAIRLEPFHDGLLNHKTEIENLHRGASNLSDIVQKQKTYTATHNVLLSAHAAKHKSYSKAIAATQASSEALDSVTEEHASALKNHRETLVDIKSEHQKIRTQAADHAAALLNHKTNLGAILSTQQNIKSKSDAHSAILSSIQQENTHSKRVMDTHDASINSMQRDILDIKRNMPTATERENNAQTEKRVWDLHSRTQNAERSIDDMKANTAGRVSFDKHVQVQVLGPRSKR